MSRINTNVTALISARILNTSNAEMNKSLERLSTGLRINRGSDDPAGLIASENLRKQIRGSETAIKNAERAANVISTAEGALSEINALLVDMQGLLGEVANSGGMSTEEINANQSQVDSILNTIDRISNSAEFEGIKLLNGNLDYTTNTIPGTIADSTVKAAKLIDGAAMTIAIAVTTSANTGVAFLSGAALSTSNMTMRIGSNRGTTDLTFAAATTRANVQLAINAVKEITGVSAATSAGAIALRSIDFGTDAYTSVTILSGQDDGTNDTFVLNTDNASNNASATDSGVNAVATINGVSANADGKILSVRTSMLDAEIELTAAGAMATTSATFNVTGGGADFAIGSQVDAVGLESIGIQNMATTSLGNATDGYISTLKSGGTNALTSTNLYTAQNIVTSAIKDVSNLRGRLGSFQKNTLESTINSMKVATENLYAAESAIRDTDFATETSRLTRSQILVQASTMTLQAANMAPQAVLSLLG